MPSYIIMPKFMRVIVFFDLPVTTKDERRIATRFRKSLIDDGYYMVQFSVYARLCGGVDSANDIVNRLKRHAPKNGSIRCMTVTEKQYAQMKVIIGEVKKSEKSSEFYQMSFL